MIEIIWHGSLRRSGKPPGSDGASGGEQHQQQQQHA
jgi:hypothetical protein